MGKDTTESLQFTLERRKHSRFLIELPVEYRRVDSSRIRPGHTINFSEDGFMVSVSEQMEVGEKLEMKIYFSPGSGLVAIAASMKITWADIEAEKDGYYRLGVSFVDISPADRERLKGFLTLHEDPRQAPAERKCPAGSRLNPHKSSATEPPWAPGQD